MSYKDVVLADAPIGYWRLDETSGTVAHDSSPGGHDGAYLGTTSLGGAGRTPEAPAAAHFDGGGGVSITGFRPLTVKCVEFWVNFHGQVSGDSWWAFGVGDWVYGGTDGSGRLRSWVPGDDMMGNRDLRWGWHHVVVQWDATSHTIFTDGLVAASRGIAGGAYTSSFDLAFGWRGDYGGWRMVGDMQDVAIYDHTLDGLTVLRHFAAVAPPPGRTPPTDTYHAAVVADNPIGYWRLDEAEGATARDSGPGGHHGAYFGGFTHGAVGAANHPTATHLDGSGGVWCDIDPSTIRCVEAWVNFDGILPPNNDWLDVIASSESWRPSNGFLISVDRATQIRSNLHGADFNPGALNSWTGWRHLVTQWDATGRMSQYVDGVLTAASGGYTLPGPTSSGLFLGAAYTIDGPYSLRGDIQEVAVYDHTLTDAAVLAHFEAGPPPPGSSYNVEVLFDAPVGYWRMDEAPGATVAVDSSGHSNDGAYDAGARTFSASDATLPMGASPRTIECWLNTTSTFSGDGPEFLMYGSRTGGQAVQLRMRSSDQLSLIPWGGEEYVTTATLNDGSWHQVVVTYSGGNTVKFYVDGALAGTETLHEPSLDTHAAGLTVGTGNDGTFVGTLAEVAVYPSALSADRILAHFTAPGSPLPPPPPPPPSGSSYDVEVLFDAPIGYWRLDETTGTAAVDSSSRHNDGTYEGSYLQGQPGPGTVVVATKFTGGVVLLPTPGPALQWTLEAWFKPNDSTSGGPLVVEDGFRTDTPLNYTVVFSVPGQSISAGFYLSGTWHYLTVPANLVAGEWHHVVATYDQRAITLYLDGVAQPTTLPVSVAALSTTNGVLIASGWNRGLPATPATIADVAIYDHALSAARVLAHFAAPILPPPPPPPPPPSPYRDLVLADAPWGYWRLGESGGSSAADISGNGNHGTYSSIDGRLGAYALGAPGALHDDADTALSIPVSDLRFGTGWGYVSAPHPSAPHPQFSAEIWVYPEPMDLGNGHVGLIGQQADWSLEWLGHWWDRYNANGVPGAGRVQFHIFHSFPPVYPSLSDWRSLFTGLVDVSLHQWSHVVATFDGDVARIYLNGVLALEADWSTQWVPDPRVPDNINDVTIGRRNDGTECFSSRLDEAAIYLHVLTPEQVLAHYTAGRVPYSAPLEPTRYYEAVMSDAPMLYWRLGESPGAEHAVDATGNMHTGTYLGVGSLGEPGALPGDSDTCFTNASTGRVQSEVMYPAHPHFTAEIWAKPGAMDLRYGSVGLLSQAYDWRLELVHDQAQPTGVNGVVFNIFDGTADHGLGPFTLPEEQWSYVVGTYDGTTQCLYVNCVLVASADWSGAPTNIYSPMVGRRHDTEGYFIGSLDEAAIYDHALSQERVCAHFAARLDHQYHQWGSVVM